jgi:ComF family protein
MWNSFRQALAASIDLLLPPACLLCGSLLSSEFSSQSFCQDCLASMPPLSQSHCSCCAQPFTTATSNHHCENCLRRPPPFSKVHAACLYQDNIKKAVQRLKYRGQLTLAKPLGQRLGKTLAGSGDSFAFDLIVPVPLHPNRLRARGFNQALEVARPIARQMSIPLDAALLQRIRKTPQQQGLSASARRSNLHNAFALTSKPSKLRILLIDDVMTTGETVRECSRTLVAGGAEEVQVAVVGRA